MQEDIWFNLGDKDMGICLYRTNLLAKGFSLVEITEKIRKLLKIDFKIYPMSNDSIQTYFNTRETEMNKIKKKDIPSKPRILIVDDEKNIRDMLRRHFKFLGYEVELAENGKEALNLMTQ